MKKNALFLFFFGIIGLTIPLLGIINALNFQEKSELIEGTVIEVIRHGSGKQFYQGFSISFTAKDGNEYTTILERNKSKLVVGNKVKFYYNPENPTETQFADYVQHNIIGVYVGASISLLGLILYLRVVILKMISNRHLKQE
jgi:uncharacterized protein YneR